MGGGAHLELYGGVHWSWRGFRWAAPRGRPSTFLALLAGSDGPRSAEWMFDALWPTAPPKSGLNALHRHVSRIRAQFRQRFDDPFDPIVRVSGGYRLHEAVTTDLEVMTRIVEGESPNACDDVNFIPRWSEQPLAGLPWEPFEVLRHRLRLLSRSLAVERSMQAIEQDRILDASRILESVTAAFPYDRELWILTIEAARRSADPQMLDAVARRLRRIATEDNDEELIAMADGLVHPHRSAAHQNCADQDRADQNRADQNRVDQNRADQTSTVRTGDTARSGFDRAATAWLMGDDAGAQDALAATDGIDPEVRRRATRIFANHEPTNGLSRQILSEMIGTWSMSPLSAERAFVALDARALEKAPDATDIARLESDNAQGPLQKLRALRVEFFLRLGQPLSQRVLEVVDALDEIDHPEASIESHRFRLVLAARRGQFADVLGGLNEYDEIVARHYPDHRCSFGDLGRLVLSLHPDLAALDLDVPRPSEFPQLVSDRSTVELAQLYTHLRDERIGSRSTIEIIVRDAAANLNPDGAHAINLLWMLTTDQITQAQEAAHQLVLARQSWSAGGYRYFLPVAIAEVALLTGDRTLAANAFDALEPFAAEELGLWPLDLLFGPCDRLLSRLDT